MYSSQGQVAYPLHTSFNGGFYSSQTQINGQINTIQRSDGYNGVGVVLEATVPPTIQALLPGLSAERSMMVRPGDQLLLVDGENALDIRRASELLRGPMGSLARLMLRRVGTVFEYECILMRGCKEYLDLFDEIQAQRKWTSFHKEAIDESLKLVSRVKLLEAELAYRDRRMQEFERGQWKSDPNTVCYKVMDVFQQIKAMETEYLDLKNAIESSCQFWIPMSPDWNEGEPQELIGKLRESLVRQQDMETQLMSLKADAQRSRDDFSEARVVTLEAELKTIRQMVLPKLNERLQEESDRNKDLNERLEREAQKSKELSERLDGRVTNRLKKCFLF